MAKKRYLRDVHVMIAVPTHGGMWHTGFAMSLIGMLTKYSSFPVPWIKSLRISTNVITGSMLCYNRDQLAKNAIKANADFILCLDSDMTFPADTLSHLLRHQVPFVAAQGVTKRIPATPVAMMNGDERLLTEQDEKGLREVDHVGMAVALVEVKYLKRMTVPLFESPYVPDRHAPMGEDVYFCRKWKEQVGLPIYVDIGLSWHIGHIGSYTYTMKDVDLSNVEGEPRNLMEAVA